MAVLRGLELRASIAPWPATPARPCCLKDCTRAGGQTGKLLTVFTLLPQETRSWPRTAGCWKVLLAARFQGVLAWNFVTARH